MDATPLPACGTAPQLPRDIVSEAVFQLTAAGERFHNDETHTFGRHTERFGTLTDALSGARAMST